MGELRIKSDKAAVYHIYTRVVHKRHLLGEEEREVWVNALHRAVRFSGVELITYCALETHVHILVRIDPAKGWCDDGELVARYEALYGETRASWSRLNARELAGVLAGSDQEAAQRLRERLWRRMGDVSEFMRTLKQRYTKWFNQAYETNGTLWSERFGSVLVEDIPWLVALVAAYIDLNPVRAGLAAMPEDYHWSGYAEALAGNADLRAALAACFPREESIPKGLAMYRLLMLGKGSAAKRDGSGGRIDRGEYLRAVENGGELEPHELLQLRVRFMTRGRALGTDHWLRKGDGATALSHLSKPPGTVPVEIYDKMDFLTANRTCRHAVDLPGRE